MGDESLLPVDGHDPAREVERARTFPARLHLAAAATPHDAVVRELAELWTWSGPDVLAVADLAETSALSGAWDHAEVVICHADPHHGNLLLAEDGDRGDGDYGGHDGDGGGCWLVDWDDAVLAPREADLIFIVGGVYSFAPITPDDENSFFDGYTPASGGVGRCDLDGQRLTYYRSVRALTDFLDFADDALDVSRPEVARADALRIAAGAVSPQGIVALSLSEAAAGH